MGPRDLCSRRCPRRDTAGTVLCYAAAVSQFNRGTTLNNRRIYPGLDQDEYGGMNPSGNIFRDAWVFGILPDGEYCTGWSLDRIQALYDQVYEAWEPNGHLASLLPDELRQRHPAISEAAPRRARDLDTIATKLHGAGILFERWQANCERGGDASQAEIIDAYRESVDRLMKHYNFKSADVISLTPAHPDKAALRQKFLDEHVHSDFEVRFFVEGRGLFFIHAADKVYAIMCERGDLLSVPANTPHWFDLGADPELKCIRLFTTPEGWVANYTGSPIVKSFPQMEGFRERFR